jgi:hypothetical protein
MSKKVPITEPVYDRKISNTYSHCLAVKAPLPDKMDDRVLQKLHDSGHTNYWSNKFINRDSCLGFTICGTQNYLIYIPKEEAEDAGHDGEFIKWYLDKMRLPKTFELKFKYYGLVESNLLRNPGTAYHSAGTYIPYKKATTAGYTGNEYYAIGIECMGRHAMYAYMGVILVRYLYSSFYSDIPRTIKGFMEKTKATAKQALFLAHMRRPYYDGHSFIPLNGNDNYFMNPFLKLTQTKMKNMTANWNGMNAAFTSLALPASRINKSQLRQLFTENKYNEIFEIVFKAVEKAPK